MAYTDAKTIKSQLRKGELSNLYYIYGEDVNGVEKLTNQIIKGFLLLIQNFCKYNQSYYS